MIHVFLSALCSVLVSVLLKLAPRFRINIGQAVAFNYVATATLTLFLLNPSPALLRRAETPWWTLAGLGILLPTIFLVLAASVRHAGIVRSDAAQRLSLVIPLLAAFVLFGEVLSPIKVAGGLTGLLALSAMVWRDSPTSARSGRAGWVYPLLVFAGFGVIDILFKRVAAAGLPLGTSLLAVFVLALVVAFCIELARRSRFTLRSALGGLLLGLCNFGNILFYLKAHRALPEQPSLVFASMNLGVVVLGALTGLLLFKERLSRLNLVGLVLALLAIALLALA